MTLCTLLGSTKRPKCPLDAHTPHLEVLLLLLQKGGLLTPGGTATIDRGAGWGTALCHSFQCTYQAEGYNRVTGSVDVCVSEGTFALSHHGHTRVEDAAPGGFIPNRRRRLMVY